MIVKRTCDIICFNCRHFRCYQEMQEPCMTLPTVASLPANYRGHLLDSHTFMRAKNFQSLVSCLSMDRCNLHCFSVYGC